MARITSPQDEVRRLISRAEDLYNKAQSDLRSTKGPLAPAVGDYLVKKHVPRGYKGVARSLGRGLHQNVKTDTDAKWRQQGVDLRDAAVRMVGRMSTRTKNLSMSGNSRKLVAKFNRLTSIKTALPYIRNLVSVLEGIEGLDLLWNEDIETELLHRREEKERLRQEEERLKMEAGAIVAEAKRNQFTKKDSVMRRLHVWSRPRRSLVSAFDRLQSPDTEAPRHCIGSCRVAIEQLCIDAGGDGDWKKGLSNIMPSDTDRRQVKAIWNTLSGKGSHGGHDPTPKEAERYLFITITTLEIILDKIET
jgi:hypothetical protein